MPIPPQVLYPLITGGISLATQIATKPKKRESATGYMDKYIANLQGDLAKKETYHTMMRSQLGAIGKATSSARREAKYLGELKGTGGGILSAEMQRIQQGQNQSISQASDQANEAQRRESVGMQSQLREAQMMREQIVQQTREANDLQDQQFTQGLIQTGLQTAGQVGMGALQAGQEQMNLQAGANEQAEVQRQESNALNLQTNIADYSVDEIADLVRQGHVDTNVAIDAIKLKQKPDKPSTWKTGYNKQGEQIEYQEIGGIAYDAKGGKIDWGDINIKATTARKPKSTRTEFEGNQKVKYNVFEDGTEEMISTVQQKESDDTTIVSTNIERVWNSATNSFESKSVSKNKAGEVIKTKSSTLEQKPTGTGGSAIATATVELGLNKEIIDRYKGALPPDMLAKLESGQPITETAFTDLDATSKGWGFLTKNKINYQGVEYPMKGSWVEQWNALSNNTELKGQLRKFIDRYNKAILKGGSVNQDPLGIFE